MVVKVAVSGSKHPGIDGQLDGPNAVSVTNILRLNDKEKITFSQQDEDAYLWAISKKFVLEVQYDEYTAEPDNFRHFTRRLRQFSNAMKRKRSIIIEQITSSQAISDRCDIDLEKIAFSERLQKDTFQKEFDMYTVRLKQTTGAINYKKQPVLAIMLSRELRLKYIDFCNDLPHCNDSSKFNKYLHLWEAIENLILQTKIKAEEEKLKLAYAKKRNSDSDSEDDNDSGTERVIPKVEIDQSLESNYRGEEPIVAQKDAIDFFHEYLNVESSVVSGELIDEIGLCIADTTGKGLRAGLFMCVQHEIMIKLEKYFPKYRKSDRWKEVLYLCKKDRVGGTNPNDYIQTDLPQGDGRLRRRWIPEVEPHIRNLQATLTKQLFEWRGELPVIVQYVYELAALQIQKTWRGAYVRFNWPIILDQMITRKKPAISQILKDLSYPELLELAIKKERVHGETLRECMTKIYEHLMKSRPILVIETFTALCDRIPSDDILIKSVHKVAAKRIFDICKSDAFFTLVRRDPDKAKRLVVAAEEAKVLSKERSLERSGTSSKAIMDGSGRVAAGTPGSGKISKVAVAH